MDVTEFVPEVEILEGVIGTGGWQVELDLDWCVVDVAFENTFWAMTEGGVAGDGEWQGGESNNTGWHFCC